MIKVSCVILNYNQAVDTVETLRSLSALCHSVNFNVILVDNASTEQTVLGISEGHDVDFQLIRSPDNLGFAGGNNLGIQVALENHSDYIWLLNNDVLVDRDSLSNLLFAAQECQGDLVGSLMCYYPEKEKIWFAGGRYFWPLFICQHLNKGSNIDQVAFSEDPVETSFVCACSVLIRREVFEKVGVFDSRFFIYGEDLDFCIRSREAGFKLLFQPKSIIWHKISQSFGGEFNPIREYYFTRNGLLLIDKHLSSRLFKMFAIPVRLLWDFIRILKSVYKSRSSLMSGLRILAKSISDFYNRRYGMTDHQKIKFN